MNIKITYRLRISWWCLVATIFHDENAIRKIRKLIAGKWFYGKSDKLLIREKKMHFILNIAYKLVFRKYV